MIIERHGDIFDSKDNLGHCVSQDFAMFKGIAKGFKNRFGIPTKRVEVGEFAVVQDVAHNSAVGWQQEREIYFLVTKKRFFHKPKIQNIRNSLLSLRQHMIANGINSVSLPRIGTGLDKQEWSRIKEIIINVFSSAPDIIVTIYNL